MSGVVKHMTQTNKCGRETIIPYSFPNLTFIKSNYNTLEKEKIMPYSLSYFTFKKYRTWEKVIRFPFPSPSERKKGLSPLCFEGAKLFFTQQMEEKLCQIFVLRDQSCSSLSMWKKNYVRPLF